MNPITDGQQPSWRFWGEDKVDGAVFNVYLKKVRYHPSSSVSFEDADDSISHLEWETVRIRIIKAGSLDRLVECLANDLGELESTYLNIFLSTYRSFSTSQQVLTAIFERYKRLNSEKEEMSNDMKEQHRKVLARALMVWMDMHPEDFAEPPQYQTLNQILDFALQFLPGSMLEIRTRHRLERCQREFSKTTRIITPPSSPDIDWFMSSTETDSFDSCPTPTYDFDDISPSHFASQLTWMDSELFKRLIPHHCLGSTWSRREKVRTWNGVTTGIDLINGSLSQNCSNTVTATVNQFNAVSARVISTVLYGLELESHSRALVITKWIDIAQELRVLKNFSSLKAVTAALQSNAIYRLKKTWMCVPREKVEVFNELARIFSEENNQFNCRKLLLKEGTAKFADSVGEDDRQLQKLMQRQISHHNQFCTVQGTVPYLGTFLTDLTMIDTAIPDLLPDGLINFDKKRKEFEVLAQIKLLQSSANNYSIEADPLFQAWFRAANTLDDNESYEISCLIEPPSLSKKPTALHKSKSVENHLGHRKTNSTSSTSTTASSISQLYDQPNSDLSSTSSSLQPPQNHNITELKGSMMRLNLSLPSLNNYTPPTPPSTSPESMESPSYNPNHVPPFYIIRVSVEQSDQKAELGVNVYKSIMLYDRDHTRTVIQNAMIKHGIEGSPDEYTLSQLLANGLEIKFPSSANVYYAINLNYDLNFVLRPFQQNDTTPNLNRKKGRLATNVPLVKRFLSSGSNSASNSSVSTMTSSTSAVT